MIWKNLLTDGSTASIPYFDVWLNRSADLANKWGAARLGNELSANILSSMTEGLTGQASHIKTLLETKLGKSLDGYNMLKEVPFEVPITSNTPGGFMKGDFVLYKLDDITQEFELVIIENKLRSTTAYTPAQKARFTVVKNAQDGTDVEFVAKFAIKDGEDIIFNAGTSFNVPKDNVLRISDHGNNVVSDLNINDLKFIKETNI